MSDKDNASQLQDRSTIGQGQAKQRRWLCLCDNIFKKGKKTPNLSNCSWKRGMRICQRNNSADPKVSGEGGGIGPGAGAEIPLQPMVKTMMRQAVPLKPTES